MHIQYADEKKNRCVSFVVICESLLVNPKISRILINFVKMPINLRFLAYPISKTQKLLLTLNTFLYPRIFFIQIIL